MNIEKLMQAQNLFLSHYPGGFQNPDMQVIGKKHKMSKMIEMTHQAFAQEQFNRPDVIIQSMIKTVSRSSMVSLFEKPKYRDALNSFNPKQQQAMVDALEQWLYDDEQQGFESMLDLLLSKKLAKWSVITIIPAYFRPQQEIFVKPTTAKGVIAAFELQNLTYKPTPSWDFYIEYRKQINHMKTLVDSNLTTTNAAFSGFLMMTMKEFI